MNTVTDFKEHTTGKNYGGDKETVSTYSVIVLNKGVMKELIALRCYMGRSKSASTVYATIWIHGDRYASGTGNAGGYGYHKESAAIDSAIRGAGIQLERSVAGVGDSAVTEALQAIALYLGFEDVLVVNH